MKINSLEIVDVKNKEAQNFLFSDGINLIVTDKNGGGKSSLIKSIYYALGFDILHFPVRWNVNDMYFTIQLNIQDTTYSIIRKNNVFKVSDCEEVLNGREYSDWLQEKLGEKIYLPSKYTENLETAYSSALILPFYIDQDSSWGSSIYKGVSNTLAQYKNIPTSLFESVLGLTSAEVVQLENEKNEATQKHNRLKIVAEAMSETLQKYNSKKRIDALVSIDQESVSRDIQNYLLMMNNLNKEISKYKITIIKKQAALDIQRQDLSELKQLLKLNRKSYNNIKLECSYCHSKYTDEMSLRRFELENNRLEIDIYKAQTEKAVDQLQKEIDTLVDSREEIDLKLRNVERKIDKSKKLMSIHQYVDAVSENKASDELNSILKNQLEQLSTLYEKIKEIKSELRSLKKVQKDRKELLLNKYDTFKIDLKRVLPDVDLNELSFLQFKSMPGSGMDKNKKYLAYYLLYFRLLKEYGIYDIPFGMDSFIKNEPEDLTIKPMFEAVENFFFDSTKQSFFSLVDKNQKFFKNIEKYNIIKIEGKLLSKQYYLQNF